MTKRYRLAKEDILPVPEWRGGCIATDRITVDGARVGYMYRETPDNDLDTGWRFFAGDEDERYIDNLSNSALYRVETIINYDPGIIGYLDAPEGSRFELNNDGVGYRQLDDTE